MTKKYDLNEYKFAKEYVKEIPALFSALAEARKHIRVYSKYGVIRRVIESIDLASERLLTQEKYYKKIVETKGEKKV